VRCERPLDLPKVVHFLVSNRHYGATSNAPLPNQKGNDYAAIARGMGLERVFSFDKLANLERDFDSVVLGNAPGHTFVVLEVEPFSPAEQKLQGPPFDGPELKFRFGRHVERISGKQIFTYSL
jgi:sulfopyruvate decarboxylase subunit beta